MSRLVRRKGKPGMKRTTLLPFIAAGMLLLGSVLAWGGDTSMLRPPKGSKVAIMVFEDLECPDCARAAPLLHEAAKQYNIPLVQYDFPLPMHPWSFEAAVNARYFDTKSAKLGDDYRLYIFKNQQQITKQNLRGVTEQFANEHKITLPFVVDPSGDLAAKVKADYQLGQRIPVDHTPTIYIVSDTARGAPFVEVVKRDELYQLIEQVMKDAGVNSQEHKTTTARKSAHGG
jgi:protein-disulfide isomerase